jgi:hypothetical protein
VTPGAVAPIDGAPIEEAPENRATSGDRAVSTCRTVTGQFARGHSGNPGGRPKDADGIRELARSHCAEAIEVLVAIMRDERAGPMAQVKAAIALLDRGFGKPAQMVHSAMKPIDPDDLSDSDLMSYLTDLTEDRRREAEAAPKARRLKKPH